MSPDNVQELIRKLQAMSANGTGGNSSPPLQPPERGGSSGDMESRVTRLETHMEYVRRDLDSIGGKLDTLIDRTTDLPTKADLWAWKWQWTALAFAMIAIVIGGIIGGLAWIQPAPSAPTPIIIQSAPAGVAAKP